MPINNIPKLHLRFYQFTNVFCDKLIFNYGPSNLQVYKVYIITGT